MKNTINLPPVAPSSVVSFWSVSCAIGIVVLLILDGFRFSVPFFILPSLLLSIIWLAAMLAKGDSVFRRIYIFFSRALSGGLLPLARFWIVSVVFYTIIAANRFLGSKHPEKNQLDMWHNRVSPGDSLPTPDGIVTVDPDEYQNWIPAFIRWTKTRNNRWMIVLLPFLLLLKVVSQDAPRPSVPSDTYTLF